MSGRGGRYSLFAGMDMREAMLLALCALIIIAARMFFRFKLGIPGHNAVFVAFALVLGRVLVDRAFAATLVALIAGLAFMALGLSKGPLALAQLLVPGLLVDALALLGLARNYAGTALLGVIAGLGKGPAQVGGFLLVGMDIDTALATSALRLFPTAAFGAVGGIFALLVARRLIAAGLTPKDLQ
jgi:hypothetical protein